MIDDQCRKDVLNRLRRVQGQLAGIINMMEDGRDCSEIMVQVAAASRALDRAGFKIISAEMQECMRAADGTGAQDERPERMAQLEKLFLTLA